MFYFDRKLTNGIGISILLVLIATTPVLAVSLVGGILVISSDTLHEVSPAVAYNSTQQEYMVIWYNDRPGNDDIRAQRLDKDGNKLGGPFYIVGGADGNDRRYPDVAYNNIHDQYLVVWENQDSSTSWRSIRARRVSGTGELIDNSDIILTGDSNLYTPTKPAVAYGSTSDRYMVVWAETWHPSPITYTIYAQMIQSDGTKDGSEFEISQGTTQRGEPDIAYNRHANRHLVVWEQYHSSDMLYDIIGRQIKGDGGIWTVGPEENYSYYTVDTINPAISSIPTSSGDIKFLTVYQVEYSPGSYDIYGKFINEDGKVAETVYPAIGNNNETAPAISGSEGAQEYLVLWREDVGIMDKPIKARQYSSSGDDLGVTHELNGPNTNYPAVAAGILGDFLITWQDTPISSYNEDIFGALFGNRIYVPMVIH